MSQIIAALCTVAIVSMDLGVSYSKSEQSIYQSFVFQSVAILSVGYSLTNDFTTTVVVFILWCMFKFTKMNLSVKAVDNSGDEVPVESFENFTSDEEFMGDEEEFMGDEEEFMGDEEFTGHESFQNFQDAEEFAHCGNHS